MLTKISSLMLLLSLYISSFAQKSVSFDFDNDGKIDKMIIDQRDQEYSKLKQLKIIGFDNTQYGNATNDGSGTSSYNLSTGQYIANWNHFDERKNTLVAVPKISKKYPLKNYKVNQLKDEVISQLQDVGYELLPSYMK
jgi:hypothetical protein